MYQREKVQPGAFADMLPEGAELYISPELPTIEFKKNGIKYKVSDLRLLHPWAIEVMNNIINMMINDPTLTEAAFEFNCEEETIDIIIDILMGISCTASKGGKNGYTYNSTIFCYGVRREYSGSQKIVVFELNKDVASIICDYAKDKPIPLSYYDMVAWIMDYQHKKIMEAYND